MPAQGERSEQNGRVSSCSLLSSSLLSSAPKVLPFGRRQVPSTYTPPGDRKPDGEQHRHIRTHVLNMGGDHNNI